MKPYYQDSLVTIYHTDNRTWQIPGLADAVISDPIRHTGWAGMGE